MQQRHRRMPNPPLQNPTRSRLHFPLIQSLQHLARRRYPTSHFHLRRRKTRPRFMLQRKQIPPPLIPNPQHIRKPTRHKQRRRTSLPLQQRIRCARRRQPHSHLRKSLTHPRPGHQPRPHHRRLLSREHLNHLPLPKHPVALDPIHPRTPNLPRLVTHTPTPPPSIKSLRHLHQSLHPNPPRPHLLHPTPQTPGRKQLASPLLPFRRPPKAVRKCPARIRRDLPDPGHLLAVPGAGGSPIFTTQRASIKLSTYETV